MSAPKFDADAFCRRVKRLFKAWSDAPSSSSWSSAETLLIGVGHDADTIYSRSLSLLIWLVGIELPDTLMLFNRRKKSVLILASKKKIDFLRPAEKASSGDNDLVVKLVSRDKADNDKKNFERFIDAMKEEDGKSVGIVAKDAKYPSGFLDQWRKVFNNADFKTVDVSVALGIAMAAKDDAELAITKKASQATSEVFSKYLKEQIMDIIDGEKKVKHN